LKQANYSEALENHFASLKIKEEISDKAGIAASYNNIGNIYLKQANYSEALENHFASLKIKEEISDKAGIAVSYNNIGVIYSAQGNDTKALENHFAALKIMEETGNKSGIAFSYHNIGDSYFQQGNYDKALENNFSALKIRKEIGENEGIASSYINIGVIYSEQSNLTDAIAYLQDGLKLFKKLEVKEGVMSAYLELSRTYAGGNDYKHAYEYHLLYDQIRDSVFNQESSRQMAEMQTKYRTEKKEKENLLLMQKNRIQQLQIEQEREKRNIQTIIFAGFLAFILLISFLIYNRYRFKQKMAMVAEVNRQQKLRFKEVVDAEEKERRRIAQELHDGLGQLLSIVKLNVSALENLMDEESKTPFINSLSLLDTACDEVRSISHNMMPSVLIRLGLLSALRELVRKINESKQLTVNMEADFNDRLSDSAEIAIYRIVQEVLNNIIKHAHAKTVAVTLHKSGEDFFIEISDDGRGFDTSLIEKSEGIGWKNIYSRAAIMNGTVDITSAPLQGMRLKIIFPKLFSES
ncbi:MAG: tetratricopeptide repeat protein, partial [Bacteroidetes bacterium]